jgi:hypothetical protein
MPALVLEPSLIAPQKLEELAQKKLKDEILPQFQFRSEVRLPGKIVRTNAKQVNGNTAIWDFRGTDFEKNYSLYTLQVTSRALNLRTIFLVTGVVVLGIVLLITLGYRKAEKKGVSRRKKSDQK